MRKATLKAEVIAAANDKVKVDHVDPRKGVVVWRKGDRVIATVIKQFTPSGQPIPNPQEKAYAESLFEDQPTSPPIYQNPMPVIEL